MSRDIPPLIIKVLSYSSMPAQLALQIAIQVPYRTVAVAVTGLPQGRYIGSDYMNLGILRLHNAISRLHKFPDCVEHIESFLPLHRMYIEERYLCTLDKYVINRLCNKLTPSLSSSAY